MSAEPGTSSREDARAAKAHVARMLAGDARVNGLGITRWQSSYAVKVNVVDADDTPDLPDTVDGVPVRIDVIGRITARAS
ncbi:hypothetical protein ACFFKU_02555 [Kineococcus gynurae]|uniref:Uncharacterized protein n=1 Tax=Kineococcus gynurae TaxID=452979 RepID=A0ABV5LSI1_9ACTN